MVVRTNKQQQILLTDKWRTPEQSTTPEKEAIRWLLRHQIERNLLFEDFDVQYERTLKLCYQDKEGNHE